MKKLLEQNKWQIDCYVLEDMAEENFATTKSSAWNVQNLAFEYLKNYTNNFMFEWAEIPKGKGIPKHKRGVNSTT